MGKKYDQAIVIPAYKPQAGLCDIVDNLKEYFSSIIVVDDGGGDDYKEIFDRIESSAIVLHHEVNGGKGKALKTAFNYCIEKEIAKAGVITVDADGQHRLPDICNMAEAMNSNPGNVVMGCRDFSTDNIPLRSYLGNTISKFVYGTLCGLRVSDTQTGLRGLPYEFLPIACKTNGDRYEYETNMLIDMKKNEFDISEIKIETVYENNNESSHFNPLVDSIKIYSVLLKYSTSSIVSALVDYLIFAIGIHFGLSIIIATYVARAVSCIFNFTLNKKLVFKSKGSATSQFIKYIALVIFSGTLSGLGITYLYRLMPKIWPVIIKVPVELILYVFNYFVQKKLIFKNSEAN